MEGLDSDTEALLSDECDDLPPSDSTLPSAGATESQQQADPQSGKWNHL